MRLAYVRVSDPWTGGNLATGLDRLVRALDGHGIDPRAQRLVGISWENDLATPLDRLVYDLGVTLPDAAHLPPDGSLGVASCPAVPAVEIHCTSLPDTARAWEHIYGSWLPGSGYEPADLPAVKRFRRVPERFDAGAWDVDCSIGLVGAWR